MDKKKSILIYSDFLPKISKLSDEQAGKLFKGLLNYSNGITPEFDDILLDYAFEDIKTTIDRDSEKYSLKCLKNKEIAIERERIKRERNSTNVNERTQVITNSTDKDIDIDIDIDIDSDILLEKETKEENLSKENKTEIFPQSESVEPGSEERKKVAQKKERNEEKPIMPDDFIEIWEEWKEYRKAKQFKSYAGLKWEQMAVDKLLELSNKNPTIAKSILKQTYENSYQGFFPLKQNSNGITNTTNTGFSTSKPSTNNGNSGKRSYRQILAERLTNELKANVEGSNITIDAEICE